MMPQSWDVERYEGRYSFVWSYGAGVIEWLDPKPGERVLDLGCGAGQLTQAIAERGAAAIGLDSSPDMIAQARTNYPKLTFLLADAAGFSLPEPVDAVFSNAALHWMRAARGVVEAVARALKPGGRFVAEFGAKGNVRKIEQAVADVLDIHENPWYFPTLGEYASLLESEGFAVERAIQFDRPTALEGADGMEDWLRMFGDVLLAPLARGERDAAIRRVSEHLRADLYRDGTWYADYRRLRIAAIKE
jgi:trans-aconitate methyltransferase